MLGPPLQGPPEAKKPEPKAAIPVHASKFAPKRPQKASTAEVKDSKADDEADKTDASDAIAAAIEVHHGMTFSEWAAAQISNNSSSADNA